MVVATGNPTLSIKSGEMIETGIPNETLSSGKKNAATDINITEIITIAAMYFVLSRVIVVFSLSIQSNPQKPS
jgi:hypothetical protein